MMVMTKKSLSGRKESGSDLAVNQETFFFNKIIILMPNQQEMRKFMGLSELVL